MIVFLHKIKISLPRIGLVNSAYAVPSSKLIEHHIVTELHIYGADSVETLSHVYGIKQRIMR
jgi:hypothetical protein